MRAGGCVERYGGGAGNEDDDEKERRERVECQVHRQSGRAKRQNQKACRCIADQQRQAHEYTQAAQDRCQQAAGGDRQRGRAGAQQK